VGSSLLMDPVLSEETLVFEETLFFDECVALIARLLIAECDDAPYAPCMASKINVMNFFILIIFVS